VQGFLLQIDWRVRRSDCTAQERMRSGFQRHKTVPNWRRATHRSPHWYSIILFSQFNAVRIWIKFKKKLYRESETGWTATWRNEQAVRRGPNGETRIRSQIGTRQSTHQRTWKLSRSWERSNAQTTSTRPRNVRSRTCSAADARNGRSTTSAYAWYVCRTWRTTTSTDARNGRSTTSTNAWYVCWASSTTDARLVFAFKRMLIFR